MGVSKKDCWFRPVDCICILVVVIYGLFLLVPHGSLDKSLVKTVSDDLQKMSLLSLGFYMSDKIVRKKE